MMRFFRILGASTVALVVGGLGQATAADLFVPPPPPEPTGCLYARVDGSARFHERPTVTKYHGGELVEAYGEEFKDTGAIEAGIGCSFTEHLRGDVTVGYAFKQKLRDGFNSLEADHSAITGFVNVYYDVADFGGITPYVGGGIGVAHHRISNVTLPDEASSGGHTSFAWNLQAGVSFQISHNIALDVGYRYVDLGDAKSGGPVPFEVEDITAHEARVGLRIGLQGW